MKSIIFIYFLFIGFVLPAKASNCDVNADGRVNYNDATLCFEKYMENCPGTSGIPCEDRECDINGDGETTPADAQQIYWMYQGRETLCRPWKDCGRAKAYQIRAKESLELLSGSMETYHSEMNRYPDSIEALEAFVRYDSPYSFSIESGVGGDPLKYRLTARSKAPGIMGHGEGDDVWRFENQGIGFAHVVDGWSSCPVRPEDLCWECGRKQEAILRTLQAIFYRQEAYRAELGTYADSLDQLSYELPSWSVLYDYEIIFTNISQDSFLVTAISNEPGVGNGGRGDDQWSINQDFELAHHANPCPGCLDVFGYCDHCQTIQAAARQSLRSIGRRIETHIEQNGILPDSLAQIGFQPIGPAARYSFLYVKKNPENSPSFSFTVKAVSKEPGIRGKGEGDDVFQINSKAELTHIKNACAHCRENSSECLQCRIVQVRAQYQMGAIRTKLEANFKKTGSYSASFSQIGYEPNPDDTHSYQIMADNQSTPKSYQIIARSKGKTFMGWEEGEDTWAMDDQGKIRPILDPCAHCLLQDIYIYFADFACRAKQGEAKQILGALAKYQEAHMAKYNRPAEGMEELEINVGFTLHSGAAYYEFSTNALGRAEFSATATSKAPGIGWNPGTGWGGAGDDLWTINRGNQGINLENQVNGCE